MGRLRLWWSFYLGFALLAAPPSLVELQRMQAKLRPLHQRLSAPGPSDWLASHAEPGQTFRQYRHCHPVLPQGNRRVLYLQPLGDLSPQHQKIAALTAEFMGLYFGLSVRTLPALSDTVVPAQARRVHPRTGERQFLTSYVLHDLLEARLPHDAAALIALTATDLWPGAGWNFVFGEASLESRVGVWSLYRLGDPRTPEGFKRCLLRTLKTATHETGHMFSMRHCIAYACNMCGSNSEAESDRLPLALCPECQAKVCWASGASPLPMLEALSGFCLRHDLKPEAGFFASEVRALRSGSENFFR